MSNPNTDQNAIDLYEEFDDEVIGTKIIDFIARLVERTSRSFGNIDLYNNGKVWDRSTREDLLQEVVETQLLARHQLEFVFSRPVNGLPSLSGLEKRMTQVIKRTLIERRRSLALIEDRLVQRVKRMAKTTDFEIRTFAKVDYVGKRNRDFKPRSRSKDELRRLADLLADIPRIPEKEQNSRQSIGFGAGELRVAIDRVLVNVDSISLIDLREIFILLFTSVRPSTLLLEEDFDMQETVVAAIGTASRADIDHLLAPVLDRVTVEQATILIGKTQQISDENLAETLGISRPTLANRRKVVTESLGEALKGLSGAEVDVAYELFRDRLIDIADSAVDQELEDDDA